MDSWYKLSRAVEVSEIHKWGHRATGRRLFCKELLLFVTYALFSDALTCELLKVRIIIIIDIIIIIVIVVFIVSMAIIVVIVSIVIIVCVN